MFLTAGENCSQPVLGDSGDVTWSEEIIMIQPRLDHVPAKQALEPEKASHQDDPLLERWRDHSPGPEYRCWHIEDGSDSPAPHPVYVLHVPDKLEVIQADVEVLPLELRAEFVFLEFLLPLEL